MRFGLVFPMENADISGCVRSASLRCTHPNFTDRFIGHVELTGARVIHRVDANARTDHDLARWGDDRILELVTCAATPAADIVLLPETALHTDHLATALTTAGGGVPVLTATQATIWSLYRAVGLSPTAREAGPLFAARVR
ncbi:hypothetical protein [Gordonia sp. NPDC058843]|uniref:hypothetical protein n=1 Tax=Gordonia sp. NPDC058843 TaxID=3346648 RepID=UPI0036A5B7D0